MHWLLIALVFLFGKLESLFPNTSVFYLRPGPAHCWLYRLCLRTTTGSGCMPWVAKNLWVTCTSAHSKDIFIYFEKSKHYWFIIKTLGHIDVFFSNRLATPSRGPTPKREEVCDLAAVNNCIRILSFWFFSHSIFFFSRITAVDAQLDDVGLSFLKNSINAIETRGELRVYALVFIYRDSFIHPAIYRK